MRRGGNPLSSCRTTQPRASSTLLRQDGRATYRNMGKRVTPPEAAELLKQGWRYIDVRSVQEFDAGHPLGALNVPLLHMHDGRMVGNSDFQKVIEANFAKEEPLVVGCKMGGRSLQAATLMEAAGFTKVVDVRGGFAGERDPYGRVSVPGWVDSGLAVATQPAPGASYEELATKAR